MNKKEKEQRTKAISIENNSAELFSILIAIIIKTRVKNSTKKSRIVV